MIKFYEDHGDRLELCEYQSVYFLNGSGDVYQRSFKSTEKVTGIVAFTMMNPSTDQRIMDRFKNKEELGIRISKVAFDLDNNPHVEEIT